MCEYPSIQLGGGKCVPQEQAGWVGVGVGVGVGVDPRPRAWCRPDAV